MTAKPGIIYLQKDKFQLFSPFLRQIVEFRFVPEIVRDADIINGDLLENLVKVFVQNTKIPPGNLTIILADNTYFVKDYVLPEPPPAKPGQPAAPPPMTMETISVMSMDFVEHVPFENVVSMTFPLKNGLKVCAANKDFYDAIRASFEKLGFTVDAVYPALVLGNNLGTKPVLDAQLVNTVFQKGGTIKQYDLLTQKVFSPEVKKEEGAETVEEADVEVPQDPKKPDKKRLYLMVGVLAFLLIILIVVYMQSLAPAPPPKTAATTETSAPAAPVATAVPAAAEVVTPSESAEVSPAAQLATQNLSLQITTSSVSDPALQSLRDAFNKYTFKNLTTQTQSTTTSSSTIVAFAPSVTQEVKNAILEDVRKVKTDVTVQEKQGGEFDITILVGK